MNKKPILITLLSICLLTSALPLVTAFSYSKTANPSNENLSIELNFNPTNFEFGIKDTLEGEFTTVILQNEGFNFESGKANLPMIRRMVEIPQGAKPEITIDSISWTFTSLNEQQLPEMIIPSQYSVEKIPEVQTSFAIDQEYYSTNSFLPENIANIVETGEIRGRHFALIEVSPIQYNPFTGDLKLMSSCQISINLPNSDMTTTYEKIQRYSTQKYEDFFKTTFENYGDFEQEIANRAGEGYLIIVYDAFFEEIQPLATLKQTQGFDVTVTKTSQIPGGVTKENIFNYIDDAYHNWNTPPEYVLLVGDTPQIPTYTGSSSGTAADLYYVTTDGTDYFPDIFIGRFPAADEDDVIAMVDKTVYYEQGQFPSDDWIKKAAFLASVDNYQTSEGTHNYVIDNYLNPNGYTCDKLYQVTYGATTQDVINSINDGRSLVVYSGHGSTTSWADGPPFSQSNVNSLMNINIYPFVCSHACITGQFTVGECFGETWLRAPNKAAVVFWGSSANTYWDQDDVLEKKMFSAWWDDGLEWVGGMTDMGLYYLYQHYGGGGYSKYYFECYNILGEPALILWTDNPNPAPNTPSQPNGPIEGSEFEQLTYSTSATDPEGEQVYYKFSWGEGTESDWIGPFNSGQQGEDSYTWELAGTYEIKAKAKDINGRESAWSEPLIVTIITNLPPNRPDINAPTVGRTGKPYEITVSATDPELNEVYFYVSWGDGTSDYWIGPYASGEEATFTHSYTAGGAMNIISKAMDSHGYKGDQIQVKIFIIKNRANSNIRLFNIFENLVARFPIIQKILNNLY